MLNFLVLFGVLTLSGFIFRVFWRLSIGPVNRYFLLRNTPTGVMQITWLLVQIYVVLGWAAFCVGSTHFSIAKPGVVIWWEYYVLAFFGCGAPLYDRTQATTNTIAVVSLASFLLFSFFPSLTGPWH